MTRSRIPHFYKMSVAERVRAVRDRGLLSDTDFDLLSAGQATLDLQAADKMIENVIGVLGMPVGLGLNFLINGKDYVVPMAVEEPSIVAAISATAKLARESGGFATTSTAPVLIGQIQVLELPDLPRARAAVLEHRQEILDLANSFHPRMVARGGGAVDLEVHSYPLRSMPGEMMLVVHLLVDTRDAMGANLVNGMCEGVASLVEQLTDGKVFLRILSNLADRALARAEVTLPIAHLAGKGYAGERVRDGVIIAADFAHADPYRAATHNKGIMNGVDAVALATGNDWRAIEAGAHAYAARHGRYSSLTEWWKDDAGNLRGKIEMPLKVGIVGGPLESNPGVAMNLRLLGVETATELAEVMAAVGLAQNFAALRALATDGIQAGHMTLHARSVVKAAGAPAEFFNEVLERVLQSGEIKVWKAQEILDTVRQAAPANRATARRAPEAGVGVGYGKIILLGEHAVVHGRHAIGCPVPLTIRAVVEDGDRGVELLIPRWGVEYQLAKPPEQRRSFEQAAGAILDQLGLADRKLRIEVFPDVPRSMGLGGSAALAVAIVRALDLHFRLGLSDVEVNELAFLSEQTAHGQPSGIDNTLATYGRPLVYRRGSPPLVELLNIPKPLSLVVGMTRSEGLTARTVANVAEARLRNPRLYEKIFDDIDALVLQAVSAIQDDDVTTLGDLMNVNQGLLNALQVSTPELERLIGVAREAGAAGAKLTGGGGGGAMIALCNDAATTDVQQAIERQGFRTLVVAPGAPL